MYDDLHGIIEEQEGTIALLFEMNQKYLEMLRHAWILLKTEDSQKMDVLLSRLMAKDNFCVTVQTLVGDVGKPVCD